MGGLNKYKRSLSQFPKDLESSYERDGYEREIFLNQLNRKHEAVQAED